MEARLVHAPATVALTLVASTLSSPTLGEETIMSPMGVSDESNCKAVEAVQEKRVVVDCPTGQIFDFCFTRSMEDRAGLISGVWEHFADPTKEAKLQHAPDQIQYNGKVNIVTDVGVLRVEENGIWDSKSKQWAGLSTVTGGTGEFEGATGKLATYGNSGAAGMVVGTVCRK